MNDELRQSDARMFDQLVDGELSTDERRQLLSTLDGRPDGWRQCALAFLEAQAWRADFGPGAGEMKAAAAPGNVSGRAASTAHPVGYKAIQWLAIAAGVFFAFGLGVFWPVDRDRPTIAENGSASPQQLVNSSAPPQPELPPGRTLGDALVFFVNDGTGGTQRVRVPLVDAGTLDRELGVRFRSGVPEALRNRLEQTGYDVHSQRRYAPLHLENGGALVLPVEDTRIVPVSPVVF
jgi:hypothetical protein